MVLKICGEVDGLFLKRKNPNMAAGVFVVCGSDNHQDGRKPFNYANFFDNRSVTAFHCVSFVGSDMVISFLLSAPGSVDCW